MALSDEDKKYIKELLTTTTKSITDNTEVLVGKKLRAQRLEELKEKKKKGKDTLAERIELEKLILRKKFIDDKFSEETQNNFGQSYRNTKEGLKTAGNVISNSSAGKSALAAIAYTNPLTALLYQNKDLLKGLGSAGALIGKGLGKGIFGTASWLYEKTRKKYDDSSTSLVPSLNNKVQNKQISSGATNYIAAKQAIFINGKNYINVMSGGKAAGMFSLPNEKATSTTSLTTFGRQNLLGNTSKSSNVIEMSKGIDGIYKSTKETSKILSLLNKRVVLISTGILLGVGAIIGLIAWLKNRFGDDIKEKYDNFKGAINRATNPTQSADNNINFFEKAANDIKSANKQDIKNKITNTSSGITIVEDKTTLFGLGKAKVKTNSKAGEPFLCPYDLTIVDLYSLDKGNYKLIVTDNSTKKVREIYPLVNAHLFCYKGISKKRGDVLGFYDESGKVTVEGLTMDQAKSYTDMVNLAASSGYSEQVKQFDQMFTDDFRKQASDSFNNKVQQQKEYKEKLEQVKGSVDDIKNISNNNLSVTKTPVDNVNTSNNNETIAINNVKASKNNSNKSTKNITTPNSKNVTIASGKQNTNIIFGVVDKFDIYAAMSDSIDITC